MRRLSALVSIMAFLVWCSGARGEQAMGWINSVDPESDELVLNDGRIYYLSDDINVAVLAEGMRVRITFEIIDGMKIITRINPAVDDPSAPARPPTIESPDFCAFHAAPR